jgi:hypothetical protein
MSGKPVDARSWFGSKKRKEKMIYSSVDCNRQGMGQLCSVSIRSKQETAQSLHSLFRQRSVCHVLIGHRFMSFRASGASKEEVGRRKNTSSKRGNQVSA